jgi:cellulose synthase/poly-beta-1,6-N-acetylglucosamine synthase-like glycosyltransferase
MTNAVPTVDELPAVSLPRWPRVSLVVPARDEAGTLGPALAARLADDYPDLEVIVVNDRSQDATGAIADELARSDARVRVVHLDGLPEGWLGKVHAMHRGSALASGEYLLLSDADTHWQPGTLRRIVARCEARGLDHLSVFPTARTSGLVLDAATATLTRMLMLAGRPWAVPDPRSRAALGIGAFNLVRRAKFERAGGFEWLRLEVADDVGVGWMIKARGGRSEMLRGGEYVAMHLYTNLGEYARSAEKIGQVFGFRATPAIVAAAAIVLVECAPLPLMIASSGWSAWLGAGALVAMVAAEIGRARGRRGGLVAG